MNKIAVIRGLSLSKWEMQNCEPLKEYYDITAFTTTHCKYDIGRINLPVVQLPFQSNGLTLYMEGLDDHLADMDLIYTGDISYLYSAQAVQAKRKYGCKVVCLEWENIPFNFEDNEAVARIRKVVRNEADHFIAVTNRAKEALILEGVPEEMIDILPMGVDLRRFRPDPAAGQQYREILGVNNDDIIILFIGRMDWEKGIYDFVHAAAKVTRDQALQGIPVRFVMAGSGPELDEVRRRTAELGMADRFNFLENCPYEDIHKLHNAADFFVLPSVSVRYWQEQFGMVLIESMACAKPVISTLSGSIPEVVGDAGMLIQPNDYLSLYRAMKDLVENKERRMMFSENALTRAEEYFDSQKTAGNILEIFKKVLGTQKLTMSIQDMYRRGLTLRNEGRQEDALTTMCKAFNKDPDNKKILASLVEMAVEVNQVELAANSLRRHLLLHPANLDALYELSKILFALGKYDDAEEELNKISIFDPDREDAKILRKQIANEKYQPQEG